MDLSLKILFNGGGLVARHRRDAYDTFDAGLQSPPDGFAALHPTQTGSLCAPAPNAFGATGDLRIRRGG